jgi:hypothetical protein
MPTIILVPGTFHSDGDWSCPGSPFRLYLASRGFECVRFEGWSGDVDGLPQPFENGNHSDWKAGGFALGYLLAKQPAPIIAHSHGGNVVAYAAGLVGISIPALVTVCTPVRKDMAAWYARSRPRIGHWRHVYSLSFDFWQRAGELLDGQVGWSREMTEAHNNIGIPAIGHSGLVDAPEHFHYWEDAGMLDVLKGAIV